MFRKPEGDGDADCLGGIISGAATGDIERIPSPRDGKRSESLRKFGRLKNAFI